MRERQSRVWSVGVVFAVCQCGERVGGGEVRREGRACRLSLCEASGLLVFLLVGSGAHGSIGTVGFLCIFEAAFTALLVLLGFPVGSDILQLFCGRAGGLRSSFGSGDVGSWRVVRGLPFLWGLFLNNYSQSCKRAWS